MILCVLVLLLTQISRFSSVSAEFVSVKTNRDRISFLEKIGLTVENNPVSAKEITIPTKFSKVYKNYNEVQKEAGYDLSSYKGVNCTVYCYKVITKYGENVADTMANLIIYNDRIIGGDISSTHIDGEMYSLKSKDGKTKT